MVSIAWRASQGCIRKGSTTTRKDWNAWKAHPKSLSLLQVEIVAQRFQVLQRERPERRVHVGALLAEPQRFNGAAFVGQLAGQRVVGVAQIEVGGSEESGLALNIADRYTQIPV